MRVWGLPGLKGLLDIGLAVFVISKSDCIGYFSHVYISTLNVNMLSTASSVSSASHITRYECRCRTSVFEALSDQIKTADDNWSGKTGIADVVHDILKALPTEHLVAQFAAGPAGVDRRLDLG